MGYPKIINLLDNTSNKLFTNSDIRFKTTLLKSSLHDYSGAYILVKGITTIIGAGAGAAARQADDRKKAVIFKNCAPFINCKNEIKITEIDNAKYIDTVKSMYNLIEYSDNYSKNLQVYGNITKMSQMIT